MSLHLEVSNSLEMLAETLLEKMKQSQRGVFVPLTIVTQTEGINLWLREYIAKKTGIAANIHFISPNEIIFKIYQVLGGTYSETISRESLIWLLYKAMGEDDFGQLFPEQLQYIQTPHSERERKRIGMATKVADLLDQYQIYRQKVITEWNHKPKRSQYLASEWQEYLWKKVKTETPKDIQDKTLVKEFIDVEIKDVEKQKTLQNAIPEIYLFGLSIFTNYHLDILKSVAPWIQVHFFLLNPAPEVYWMDDASEKQVAIWRSRQRGKEDYFLVGNPLLTNWGKVLQNTFRLLFKSEDLINKYNSEHVAVPECDSLLHKIQANIFNNNVEDNILLTEQDLKDETLSIHSCYTIAAEVEALYQYLVHLVDHKNVPLSARDISVMVSDIDKYEPYIKAVFDNAPYKFRYKIADVSSVNGDNIYNALRLLLELNESEFTSEKVLQLLESTYIRKRFRLDNVDALRHIVTQANIRFGIEGDVEDDTFIVSWRYGIQRLMYGICMSGEILMEKNGFPFYTLDIVEGNGSQLVVRFCHFVDILMDAMKRRHQSQTPTEWIAYVQWLLDNLVYQVEDNVDEDYYDLKEHLSTYGDLSELNLEKVPFEVFRIHFLASLDANKRSSLFINDGITFCSLIPMRSVPFKVIALLGMNAKDFPRREKPLSFSLLQQTHQLGDRNVKDSDKHLFLETLISAQEYLYISYIGHSVRDNAVLSPSLLVEELLDYIKLLSSTLQIKVEDYIVTQHPLHSFSPKYNSGNPKLYKYAQVQNESREILGKLIKSLPENLKTEIVLSKMIAFFKDAPKSFYNNVLGVYYNDDHTLLPETEIFDLGSLENAIFKKEMLSQDQAELEIWKNKLRLTGKIPLKNAGIAYLEKLEEVVSPVNDKLSEIFPNMHEMKVPIHIGLHDNINITGELSGMYGKTLVAVCFSKSIKKHFLGVFLQSIAGIVMNVVDAIYFVVVDPSKENEAQYYPIGLTHIDPKEALQLLTILVGIYQEGLTEPIPFSGDVYRDMDFEKLGKLKENGLEAMFQNKNNAKQYDLDPYYVKSFRHKVWNGQNAVDKFQYIFQTVFAPMQEVFPELFG